MHSQEPWRHTLKERQFREETFHVTVYVSIYVFVLMLSLCMHNALSPGVAILRDSGSWREMSAHVHTGTLRDLHTAITIQNLTHWNIVLDTQPCVTTRDRETGRGRGRYNGCEVTRACTAIYTVFLADLLDVETMAGCGAGLGAFTVLHSNWTLGDYINKHTCLDNW